MTTIEERIQKALDRRSGIDALIRSDEFKAALKNSHSTPGQTLNAFKLGYAGPVAKRNTTKDNDDSIVTAAELLADLAEAKEETRLVKQLKYLVEHVDPNLAVIKICQNHINRDERDVLVMQNLSQYLPEDLRN